MDGVREVERVQTVVIGGGQAGLSAGYHLARRDLPFVILDAHDRVGDQWRGRWDSLRLFTPARFAGLDGMPFPAEGSSFPTKDQMADYLEAYVERFALPVRNGVRVDGLSRLGDRFLLKAGERRFEAEQVVVAMASYQVPRIPAFAAELRSDIVQLHSSEYRNQGQLRPGGVLIVGAGNSGAEIAVETAPGHRTWLAGRGTGHLPLRIETPAGQVMLRILLRLVFHRMMTVNTPWGRRLRKLMLTKGGPLIRQRPKDLAALGIERVPRMSGARDGLPVLDDGRVLDVANVIWCTGFHPGFSWIDLPVFGDDGEPLHNRGVVPSEPGLYFLGLHFIFAASSAMTHGVGRDARRIADVIAKRVARREREQEKVALPV